VLTKFDASKALEAAGSNVLGEPNLLDLTASLEGAPDGLIVNIQGEVSNEDSGQLT